MDLSRVKDLFFPRSPRHWLVLAAVFFVTAILAFVYVEDKVVGAMPLLWGLLAVAGAVWAARGSSRET